MVHCQRLWYNHRGGHDGWDRTWDGITTMARPAKPWYWGIRDAWYATVKGKRYRLAGGKENRADALKELGRLLAMPDPSKMSSRLPEYRQSVRAITLLFLDFTEANRAKTTYENYRERLRPFCKGHGNMALADLRPKNITDWLATKSWGQNSRRGSITVLKRLTSWAKSEDLIEVDHLLKMSKPSATIRRVIPTTADVMRLIEASEKQGRQVADLFTTIWETGCRVSEAMNVTANEVDLKAGTWTMHGKTTEKTGKDRVVYLGDKSLEICRRLVTKHPNGPIFRKQDGSEWRRQNASHHMRKVRKELGFGDEMTLVSFRHLFVTDGLERGIPIATVSELVGHADTRMVCQVYSKLYQRKEYLRAEAAKIRPGPSYPVIASSDPDVIDSP